MENANEFLNDSALSTVLLVLGCIAGVVLIIYIYPLINHVWSCINKAICIVMLLGFLSLWIAYGVVRVQMNEKLAILEKGLTNVNEFLH